MTEEKLLERISKAELEKSRWSSYLDECYTFFMPGKNLFQGADEQIGQQKDERVFDSTAIDSLGDFASRMEARLVPAGREWMKLVAGSDIPKEKEVEVNKLLEDTTEVLFEHINSSNFSSQINETFLDLGISTGAIIVEEGDGVQSSLRFRAVPLKDLIIERSENGIVETVYRRIKLPYGDLRGTFPRADLGEYTKEMKDTPQDEIELIEGTYFNADVNGNPYTTVLLDPSKKKYLFNEEQESSPYIIFRENTTPGETYGRGRAMRCLSDVKTLNKTMQYYIETCELLGNPIYTAIDDGIINPNTITIRPKTIIPTGAADSIQPLPMSGSPELSIDLINRLQGSIRRTMLSKPFGNIEETPVRTATEISIRNADLAETSASASGRIQLELLERLIKRCVYILRRAGKIAAFNVDGKDVKIRFVSPSSRAQDEVDVAVTMRYMEMMQALPPELVNMTVKVEDIPKYLADTMGVSASLIRTKSETAEKQQEMEQQAQAQAQAEAQMKGQ